MYLGAARESAETTFENAAVYPAKAEVFTPWREWEPSQISHHGLVCCELVREWVANTDYSALNGGKLQTGPRWIRQRFDWGPGKYPIYWCEVLKKSKLDCGVHAALAHEAFIQRGVRAYRAQLVQEFSRSAMEHWRSGCEGTDSVKDWIGEGCIYHEGCAVSMGEGKVKLWDSSAGWWVDPRTTSGYGSLRALRIAAANDEVFQWGPHRIVANSWTEL